MNDLKHQYYGVILGIWKLFREDIERITKMDNVSNDTFESIVNRYIDFYKEVPDNLREYANNIILLHVREVENICGDKIKFQWGG